MRILFHHRIASRDGQAVHMEALIAALRRQGHETILVGPRLAATGFGGSNKVVDRVKAAIPAALWELLELAYNLRAFVRLWTAVRRHRPDVIYERFSLLLLAGLWVRRLTGIPLLMEVNSPLFEERAANDGLRLHRLGRWAQGVLWRGADHVLPVTGVLARIVAEYGVAPARISVVPNGIDPGRFPTPPPRPQAGVVIGFTGFVRGWNAVHRLIDFVARHPARDLTVRVVGDGPARQSLLDHAAARGVAGRFSITGIVARDRVAAEVAEFDIAVIPGVTPYASPLKLFEYLQLGRAVVAPDMANIREILADGENAVLFDPKGEDALESALLRLCDDTALRRRLEAAGPRTIARHSLTWDHNAAVVAGIADPLVRERGQPA